LEGVTLMFGRLQFFSTSSLIKDLVRTNVAVFPYTCLQRKSKNFSNLDVRPDVLP
jgi:hypothetical protein